MKLVDKGIYKFLIFSGLRQLVDPGYLI